MCQSIHFFVIAYFYKPSTHHPNFGNNQSSPPWPSWAPSTSLAFVPHGPLAISQDYRSPDRPYLGKCQSCRAQGHTTQLYPLYWLFSLTPNCTLNFSTITTVATSFFPTMATPTPTTLAPIGTFCYYHLTNCMQTPTL